MKRPVVVPMLIAIFVLSASLALCDVVTKNWEFNKAIRISDYSKKAVAIPLDAQVYNSAKEDLSDLRVLGPKNEECPYAITSQDEVKKEQKLESSVISKQITPTDSIIVVWLKDPLKPFNGLKVISESNNFARKITVEGSSDNKTWEIIRKDMIIYSFAFQMTYKSFEQYTNEIYETYGFGKYSRENLAFQFPESTFKYIRVTVPHDKDKEPVELKNIEIFNIAKLSAIEESYKSSLIKIEPDKDGKSIENIFDFKYKDVPLSRIDINTDQSNFFRKVEVAGSNDLKEWKNLASGVIFSIAVDEGTERNTIVDIGNAEYRYIKVKVFNGDNKAVKITSIKGYGLKKYLVIIPEKNIQYELLYGNPGAKAVSYDLGAVIKGKPINSFGEGLLGNEVKNDKYEPYKESKPWTEDRPYILWIAMCIIIFGMIFLGSQVIKKIGKNG
jgi:hypothetical protein